ncbi:hypothetical protein [Nonomuraea insulae]|uniref:Uncharacterized protein n=1 Tax=Nonomuraea insulae TaxID=1616787 RepID=A0ABW1CNN1_9ACTN
MRLLTVVNGALVVGSMASAVIGLVKPSLLLPGGEVSVGLELYAARALPLGAAVLYALSGRAKPELLLPMLTVAGIVQAVDVVIGLRQGVPGMVVGGSVSAVVHLASAWILHTRQRPAPAAA